MEATTEIAQEKVADLPPLALAGGGPTRSKAQSNGPQERSAVRSVALDLGLNKICLSEVRDGKVVHRATVRKVEELLPLLGPETAPARVAIEACREAWAVYDRLREWGKEPCLVDTTRSRQVGIGQHGRKSDRLDADHLAVALDQGRLPAAHLLSPARREMRHHLGVRRMLVESRAQMVTTIRGIVRAQGERMPSCAVESFVATVRRTALSEATRLLIEPALAVLGPLEAQLIVVERKLEHLCAREPVVQQLCTAPGVSLIVAAAFVSVIDEARRFTNAHQVESYLGLVPSEDTTGGANGSAGSPRPGTRTFALCSCRPPGPSCADATPTIRSSNGARRLQLDVASASLSSLWRADWPACCGRCGARTRSTMRRGSAGLAHVVSRNRRKAPPRAPRR
jgi:transposase